MAGCATPTPPIKTVLPLRPRQGWMRYAYAPIKTVLPLRPRHGWMRYAYVPHQDRPAPTTMAGGDAPCFQHRCADGVVCLSHKRHLPV
ncbi:MAG: hypothetical protein LDL12_08205 [Anaerolinea sp.]|nr:hypothetical protein [Anaerolinea sp.]